MNFKNKINNLPKNMFATEKIWCFGDENSNDEDIKQWFAEKEC